MCNIKVSREMVAAYLTAEFGEVFGVYADGSFAVGESVGAEIAPDEQPIAVVRCPGIGNIETTYWVEGLEEAEPGTFCYEGKEYDLKGLIQAEITDGVDIDAEIADLKRALEDATRGE